MLLKVEVLLLLLLLLDGALQVLLLPLLLPGEERLREMRRRALPQPDDAVGPGVLRADRLKNCVGQRLPFGHAGGVDRSTQGDRDAREVRHALLSEILLKPCRWGHDG